MAHHHLNIIRIPAVVLVMMALLCCKSEKADNNNSKTAADSPAALTLTERLDVLPDSIVQFLLDASARDFYDHPPPIPVDFRNVSIGFLEGPDNEKNYLLCGQFLSEENKEKNEWIPFATIKTSDYEQWIGANALSYCQDAKGIFENTEDLSSALKVRLDSLRTLPQKTK